MRFYNSRYNFRFITEKGCVMYNSKTGLSASFGGEDALQLTELLVGQKKEFAQNNFTSSFLSSLIKKGFLVDSFRSELMEVREQYWSARGETPIALTITTTMDCNLGCYY